MRAKYDKILIPIARQVLDPAQVKDVSRTIGHHGIDGAGIDADPLASKVDFIQEITGGGEWRVAAQDSGVERTDERKRGRLVEEKLVGSGAQDERSQASVDERGGREHGAGAHR